MHFDPNNDINKLCAKGMELEGAGKADEAKALFLQAWDAAGNSLEKFTAAHYLARHQHSIKDKLKWDETALEHALQINDPDIKATYPSLYLNIAKCYEDLKDAERALQHYKLAESYTDSLNDDGYGNMIKGGIQNGFKRLGHH